MSSVSWSVVQWFSLPNVQQVHSWNIPKNEYSKFSAIITKWNNSTKWYRPCKFTELWKHMLAVLRSHQMQSQSLQTSKLHTAFRLAQACVHELQGMGFHGWADTCKPYSTKSNAKRLMQTRVLWSDHHTSLSGNLMDEFEFGVLQENGTAWLHCAKHTVKFSGGGIMVWGCFSGLWVSSLFPVKGTLNNSAY